MNTISDTIHWLGTDLIELALTLDEVDDELRKQGYDYSDHSEDLIGLGIITTVVNHRLKHREDIACILEVLITALHKKHLRSMLPDAIRPTVPAAIIRNSGTLLPASPCQES
jgi:hypothetical protein